MAAIFICTLHGLILPRQGEISRTVAWAAIFLPSSCLRVGSAPKPTASISMRCGFERQASTELLYLRCYLRYRNRAATARLLSAGYLRADYLLAGT